MLRATAFGIVSATTTAPWPRMRTAGLSASDFASARPSAAVSMSMLVMPAASRISKTGTPDADVAVAVHDAFRREDVIRGDEIAKEIRGRRLRTRTNLRQQRQYAQRQEFAAVDRHSGSGFMNVPSGARAMSFTATIASRLS